MKAWKVYALSRTGGEVPIMTVYTADDGAETIARSRAANQLNRPGREQVFERWKADGRNVRPMNEADEHEVTRGMTEVLEADKVDPKTWSYTFNELHETGPLVLTTDGKHLEVRVDDGFAWLSTSMVEVLRELCESWQDLYQGGQFRGGDK